MKKPVRKTTLFYALLLSLVGALVTVGFSAVATPAESEAEIKIEIPGSDPGAPDVEIPGATDAASALPETAESALVTPDTKPLDVDPTEPTDASSGLGGACNCQLGATYSGCPYGQTCQACLCFRAIGSPLTGVCG
ncbi:MAG: hypothetical protein AAF657_26440 [Acidobacteriota bacterium]